MQVGGRKGERAPRAGCSARWSAWSLLLVGATTVLAELQDDLDRVWKVAPKPNRALGLGALAHAVVRDDPRSASCCWCRWWSARRSRHSATGGRVIGDVAVLGWVLDVVVALAVISTLFALIYKILPDAQRAPGATSGSARSATAVLFTVGKFLIGLYIGKAASDRASAPPVRWRCCWSGSTTRRRSSCWAPSSPASTPTVSARRCKSHRPGGRRRARRRTPAGPGRATAEGLSARRYGRRRGIFQPAPCAYAALTRRTSASSTTISPAPTARWRSNTLHAFASRGIAA